MPQYLIDNDATATRRRVYFLIYADAAGTPWAGSVTGLKAQRSVSGGAETATTADIVRVGGAWHYVELTQAETNVTPGDRLLLRVAAAAGRLEAPALADTGVDDVFASAPTDASISAATVTAMRAETVLTAWGVTSQPVGGSTITYPERRNGVSIGTRTAYLNSANVCVGMTAVV